MGNSYLKTDNYFDTMKQNKENVRVETYFVQVRRGREKKVAANILKLKDICGSIMFAEAMPFGGYVKIGVAVPVGDPLQDTAKELVEMLTGVVRLCGNGNEPVAHVA